MSVLSPSTFEFGIFDWIDESRPLQLAEIYEQRLRMLEYADAAGFWCYHLAEHHGTPLGMAPSPSLFLAAAAQRTQRIRLGPLCHLLPLYNPLRHIEEICMLDHLTRGRLELGIGRGISPAELALFNVGGEESRGMFHEALEVVLGGLATGKVSHEGRYYRLTDVAIPLRPYQRPYPPLWYPTSNPESVPWVAAQGMNILFSATLPSFSRTGELIHQYASLLEAHRDDSGRLNAHVASQLYGFSRHVYVGETDAQAWREAKVAYEEFDSNYKTRPGRQADDHYALRPNFETAAEQRRIFVGSPATVRDQLKECADVVGGNYFVGVFAFGNLTTEQILGSLQRFTEGVMPAFAGSGNPLSSPAVVTR